MPDRGFTEDRIPVETDGWTGDMTLLHRATSDRVYDAEVQWVMLRLDGTGAPDYTAPDETRYEVDTAAPAPDRHTTSYTLTKTVDRRYDRGLAVDDLLGYTKTFDGDRAAWWGDADRTVTRYTDDGRADRLRIAADTDDASIALDAEQRPLGGWHVTGALERTGLALDEALARIRHETGLPMPDLLDDAIDGTWNW